MPIDIAIPAIPACQETPSGQLTLAGPTETLDAAHWPVRGDLAHIRLAGRCFVPHYAVPMPHVVKAPGAALRKEGQRHAEVLAQLHAGDIFNVLDMSGGWCWGQVAQDGFVGYIPHDLLAPVTP
ncbi:MAG: SH3 domain-containing protein [Pseudomonadota bacterium]|nr:SH3 domain-containing protein [Pseudomonadota bacterium]